LSTQSNPRARRLLLLFLLMTILPTSLFAFNPFLARPVLEFPKELQWLNVKQPLTAEDLKGKVVILDFWTYGCINCVHVVEELRLLEERFGHQLAVIGVHSPKFDNEKNLEALRNIVVRLDRRHPIVNDPDWILMDRLLVHAWPTLVIFAPDGTLLGKVTGERNEKRVKRAVEGLIEIYSDEMDDSPLPLALEQERFAASRLAAPGKIAVSADGKRVAVSDTLHHRVILAQADGKILDTFGDGQAGFLDGAAAEARFRAPQGLVFQGEKLLVADAGNHAVRLIDPGKKAVTTLAGTGRIGILRPGEYDALHEGLRSPWALAVDGQGVYIAMAGNHQIWQLDLTDGKIRPYAGSRREGIDTGSLRESSFSQPSGLALAGDDLYVADAEASAIRRIDTDEGEVENLVGTGLFDFGDRDGPLKEAQLQHATGVAVLDPKRLVIADSYNHKIKLLDLKAGEVTTLLGTGSAGKRLGDVAETELNEPGGVAVLGERILIADTNNHRILLFSPEEKKVEEWVPSE